MQPALQRRLECQRVPPRLPSRAVECRRLRPHPDGASTRACGRPPRRRNPLRRSWPWPRPYVPSASRACACCTAPRNKAWALEGHVRRVLLFPPRTLDSPHYVFLGDLTDGVTAPWSPPSTPPHDSPRAAPVSPHGRHSYPLMCPSLAITSADTVECKHTLSLIHI